MTDPVGTAEIAERLSVTRNHVKAWRRRGRAGQPFPTPRWTVGGRPCWDWPDVEAWHAATRRLPDDEDDTPPTVDPDEGGTP